MTSPYEPAAARALPAVQLTIDEATVVLGLLDLLQPPPSTEPALITLVDRTRARLATSIAATIAEAKRREGIHLV